MKLSWNEEVVLELRLLDSALRSHRRLWNGSLLRREKGILGERSCVRSAEPLNNMVVCFGKCESFTVTGTRAHSGLWGEGRPTEAGFR